ncbi:MAG: NHL repeat-containing protein [Clostridia bacterium]|nr:NHL repeat-containing protein [Clostridia bacterium]
MKKIKFITSVITFLLMFVMSFNVSAVKQDTGSTQTGEVPYQSYTYWVDYNTSEKTPVYSKPMYEVKNIVSAELLGADANSRLNDVTTDEEGNVYILDSGNSKIFVLDANYNLSFTLQNIIYNGSTLEFIDAQGIFVDNNGVIYIADTENQRVICMDKNGNVIKLLLLPESELIPTDFKYRPVKVAVDSKGYTYIASDGSYNGAILYSPQMEFLGFFGANTVKATAGDVIKKLWDRFTSNDIKRAADEISLPYAFTDIVVGPDDFIYTTTGKGGKSLIQTGQICVLNPGGKDVLGGSDKNFADSKVGNYLFATLSQSLNNIDVDNDGFVYVLDTTYGRIFWYDSKSNLFSVFGGSAGISEQKGTFSLPSAIAVTNGDVLVTDAKKNTLTVFGMTKFGKNVAEAQKITLSGDFAAALKNWEAVITEDSNCQLAYRGVAKAYYDSGDNIKAMEYARLGVDRETYADAFELRRTELIEKNFYLIAIALVVLIVAVSVLVYFKRKKEIVLVKNIKLKVALSSM